MVAMVLGGISFSPGGVWALTIDLDWVGDHAGEVITSLSYRYSTSLQKDMAGRFLALYGGEFPLYLYGGDRSNPFTQDVQEEARYSTRAALMLTTKEMVDGIEFLTRVKEYTRGLTQAVLVVGKQEIKFHGPSPNQTVKKEEISERISYFRSVLTLTNDFPFNSTPLGVTVKTTFPQLPSLETRLTYYLSGQEIMRFQVEKSFTPHSVFNLGYRVSEDDNHLFAALQFHFN